MSNTLKIIPVVLAGGSGTRLWPISRESYPKQFLNLVHEKYSLFQQTLLRLERVNQTSEPIVVSNEQHRFIVLDQLHELKKQAQIILEPVGKNTAPSLTLASLSAVEQFHDAILIVVPSDHVIQNDETFVTAIECAVAHVSNHLDTIVTLGIEPTYPETGYGYIHYQKQQTQQENCYNVQKFVEKPNIALAEQYLQQGNYLWNAGIFVVKASTWLKAIEKYAESMAQLCTQAWQKRTFDIPFIRPAKDDFESMSSDSIDYAVMEHCPNQEFQVSVVPLNAGWSDLGSWQSVSDYAQKAPSNNTILIDSERCMVESHRLVALVGVKDLIVVETPDAILVTHKESSQNVKYVVEQLKNTQRNEHLIHRKVYRPWGWYDSIDEEERFKVKRIYVKPKASLSLQKHYHRAEHWVVVKGTAEVQCGDKTLILTENQSTYIPLGEIHRLSNPGTIPLELIEVQSGSYLEEDDIVRFEDDYGRFE